MRHHSVGYSLLEVAIVIALLMMLAAVAVPSFVTAMNSWQLSADARGIATSLVNGKFQAISQATRYQVIYALSGGTWTPQKFNRTANAFENDGPQVNLSNEVGDSGIHFQESSTNPVPGFPSRSSTFIRFNSRGLPINEAGISTGSNVVYLTDDQTDYAITVSLLGRIELWRRNERVWLPQ